MQLESIISNFRSKLLYYDHNFIDKHKINDLIVNARAKGNDFYINYKDNIIVKNIEDISKEYDNICKYCLNKYIILNLINGSLGLLDKFPNIIRELFLERFSLIVDDIINNPEKPYDFASDIFRKDISICCLHMFPAGSHVVHEFGVGRIFIIRGGARQFLSSLAFYLFKMHKNYPYYHFHVDPRCLSEFTDEGRNKCFLRIAEMLRINKHVRGLIGASWYYDPVIDEISPRLSYLRKTPLSNGAKTYRYGASESDINDATATSKNRKDLYLKGKYHPTCYILIWLRDDLIRWADSNLNLLNSNRINETTSVKNGGFSD